MYGDGQEWNTTIWSYGIYDEDEIIETTELYDCVICECNSGIYGKNSTSTVICNAYQYDVKNVSFCGMEEQAVMMNCSDD